MQRHSILKLEQGQNQNANLETCINDARSHQTKCSIHMLMEKPKLHVALDIFHIPIYDAKRMWLNDDHTLRDHRFHYNFNNVRIK